MNLTIFLNFVLFIFIFEVDDFRALRQRYKSQT